MYSNVVLNVSGVCKEYELLTTQKQKFAKLISDFRGRPTGSNIPKHSALKNVTFTAHKGEVIGVLGKNGAGKSTLLQIICGTVSPTRGSVMFEGRLAALLELGAGFNPDFTGRENIYINASILGLSQHEIESKFESIISFADIGDFIDQPVKNYSSGMFMRLAFAVATSIEPDVLIVDEALAVGDAKFQSKCFRKISELKENGTTILLVSHSTEQITRHCSKALILDGGKMLAFGDAKEVANQYLELLFGKANNKNIIAKSSTNTQNSDERMPFNKSRYYNRHEHHWGNGSARLFDFNIMNGNDLNPSTLDGQYQLQVSFKVEFLADLTDVIIGVTLKTQDGITVFGRNTQLEPDNKKLQKVRAGSQLNVSFCLSPNLCSGNYLLSIGVVHEEDGDIVPLERRYDAIIFYVENKSPSYGIVDLFNKVEIFQ